MAKRDYEADIDRIIKLFSGGATKTVEHPSFRVACEWLRGFPADVPEYKQRALLEATCMCFQITESELLAAVAEVSPRRIERDANELEEEKLREILPKDGWFSYYDDYTAQIEVPLSFQISASLVVLGAAVGRKAWLDWAHWKIYPNYCSILIGPTGRVHKTVACDIAQKLITEAVLCPVMPDKMTPEFFAECLANQGGHQFLYAGEFTMLFNKQRYNDGFVVSIIRMLDCPDRYDVGTITRGERIVENVALSILGGSTLSLLATAAPAEVLSSGFLNRFVLVVEDDTPRSFPIPRKNREAEAKILELLRYVKTLEGEYILAPSAETSYIKWYNQRVKILRNAPDEATAEILQRTHTNHVLKIALLMHMVRCDGKAVCEGCLTSAIALVEYYDRHVPRLVRAISKTQSGIESEYILDVLERLGGSADHSTMIRKTQNRMRAAEFKSHMHTLVESGLVREEKRGVLRFYILITEHK